MPLTDPWEPGVTGDESSLLWVSHCDEESVLESVAELSELVSSVPVPESVSEDDEEDEESEVEPVVESVVESVPASVDGSVVEVSVLVFSETDATSWVCADSSACVTVMTAPSPMTATLVAATAALMRLEIRRC